MPYTHHVDGRKNAAILAALICLPAIAHAGVPILIVPHVTYDSRDVIAGRAPSTSLGGWEVTTGFDPIRCEVYCIYRQRSDASGRTPLLSLLAPPITVVEVYTGPAQKPIIVTFDPAGLGLPAADTKFVPKQDRLCLPGRKVAVSAPATLPEPAMPASYRTTLPSPAADPQPDCRSALPLRI
jgi:hypothetical protein